MTDHPRCKNDTFWAVWLFLLFALAFCFFCVAGCEPPGSGSQVKLITKEEKDELEVKELRLPPGAKNVHRLDEYWHTFDLTIDGRTRKFLRRIYGIEESYQAQYATESVTELTPQ